MSQNAADVASLGSQLGPSQRDDEPNYEHANKNSITQGQGGGKKRVRANKPRFLLKVKLPAFTRSCRASSNKEASKADETHRSWAIETSLHRAETADHRGDQTKCDGADCDSVGKGVVIPSRRSHSKELKEKVRLAVVQTISKMLEENQLLRQTQPFLSL